MRDCLPEPSKRDGLKPDPEKQRRRLCVLPSFDLSLHPPVSQCGRRGSGLERRWMGLPPDHAKHGIDQHWARPFEDIESQGCPCGWDSAFYRSVLKYVRRRTDDGGRVENKLLSLTEDPLVIEAVEALEEYQEQWLNECRRKLHAEYKAKQKARER